MKSILQVPFVLVLLLTSCKSDTGLTTDQLQAIMNNKATWNQYVREMNIDNLLSKLSGERPSTVLFKDANIITMMSDEIRKGDVLVRNGRIARVSLNGSIDSPEDAVVVEASGKYLMPGLTDAHVHIGESSNADLLLYLANGVTTLREMCGFDWMIPYRKRIENNELLAPNLYVAGTMLNYSDLGIYSDIVKTEEEAREKVRSQKQKGFDFIKVWNVMPYPLLSAIADECKIQGMDLVGHVPHDVTVAQALGGGYRTLEHFKGFIIDSNLTLSDEDYVSAIQSYDAEFWLSPTFSLSLQARRGDEALTHLEADEAYQYIPAEVKESWKKDATNLTFDDYGNKPDSIFKMELIIYNRLRPLSPNYIAGTDHNGSNSFMVGGFILHEELKIFRDLGMSNFEVLKTATTNAANAMHRAGEFGTIEEDKRADLLLLDENPLDNVDNLASRKAVMVRGIFLSADEISEMLKEINQIYQGTEEFMVDEERVNEYYQALLTHYTNAGDDPVIKPISRVYFAWRLGQIGRYNDAIGILNRVLDQNEDYTTHDVLASVYLKAKDSTSAIIHYRRSRELYPQGAEAEQQLKLLSN